MVDKCPQLLWFNEDGNIIDADDNLLDRAAYGLFSAKITTLLYCGI